MVNLWHDCQLGRGAAGGLRPDTFEAINFHKTYFDRDGLILAFDEETGEAVGFVHAGFGSSEDQSSLNYAIGVICVIMVLPDYRRRGIGSELLKRAESYLIAKGATEIRAGAAAPHDPFYMGLYGGTKPAGFLESDPDSRPFVEARGYQEHEQRNIYFRDAEKSAAPMNMKIMDLRRRMQLAVTDRLPDRSWWNACRYSNLDYIRFLLQPKNGESPVGGVTIIGLDFYLPKWNRRVVGMTDVFVVDDYRRQSVGQTLIMEVCKRLKEELITGAEAHARAVDEPGNRLLKSVGFYQVDTGIVFHRDVEQAEIDRVKEAAAQETDLAAEKNQTALESRTTMLMNASDTPQQQS
ncbi:MAG: GNAT family N-acetyltransferase [Planctomycetaceae bacterium]|nr:GNAT family N-acetyltransferase [Planctomycetaceae bacterium]